MLRRAVGGALAGGAAWLLNDAATDALLYHRARAAVAAAVAAPEAAAFLAQLGGPGAAGVEIGPWWDASVSVAPGGMLATVALRVAGAERASDVRVRLGRRGGLRWPLAHTALGGEWEVLAVSAAAPGGGGLGGAAGALRPGVPPHPAPPAEAAAAAAAPPR
jgi:hypothetical protein